MTRPAGKSKPWKKPPSKPAFYLDEGVPIAVATTFRTLGCNAATVPTHLRSATDIVQLAYATKLGRIFVAIDRDFIGYMFPARRIIESPGIIFFITTVPTERQLTKLVHRAVNYINQTTISGKICLVSDGGVRLQRVFLLPFN